MTTIGNIINTHTGPARVVVMLPAAAKTDQQSYSQALTQAVAGGLVSVPGANPAGSQQPGGQTPSSSSDSPAISTSAAVQSVFVEHPQAMGAPEMSANLSGAQGQSGSSFGGNSDTSSQDDGQTGDQNKSQSQTQAQAHSKWEPTGLAKVSALYRHTGKIADDHSAKLDISG